MADDATSIGNKTIADELEEQNQKSEHPTERHSAQETLEKNHEDKIKTDDEHKAITKKPPSETSDDNNAENEPTHEEEEQFGEEEHHEALSPIGEDDGIAPISSFNVAEDEAEAEGEEGDEEETATDETEPSSASTEVDKSLKLDRIHLQTTFEEIYLHKKRAERRKALLNRKVSEYYRRQQNYGVFNQESVNLHKDYIQRYRLLLLDMDMRLATKKQYGIDSKNAIEPLKHAIEQTKHEYNNFWESFSKLFFDTAITLQGSASGKELKETTVLNILKRMSNIRDIINVERLEFIRTENLVAEIEVKAKSLEDLGNGLRMVDFEQLRSETQSLSDKIEERNNELEKLRLRCNADTQILAHVREKDFMLHNTILNQREILKETNLEVDCQRERCNFLKGERDAFRKKHSDLSLECGLLDKPLLLRDYDITISAIEKKEKEIAHLEIENAKIEKAVHEIAIILSEGELIKTDSQKFEESLLREISMMDAPIFPRIKKP